MSEPPLCRCHREPMLFHTDSRYRAGGFYGCRVKNRESCRAAYAANRTMILQMRRDRYDGDPVYRIGKRLRDNARSRAKTLQRKREALRGAIPPEGRDRPTVEPHPPPHHP